MPAPPALLGTYTPPALPVGTRAYCRYRRAWCRVTSWTDAPLPWPRCQQIGIRGGSGLLVTAELVRAVRTESAAALKHWFGVGTKVAWNWRKRFVPGSGHVRTEGDRVVQRRASAAGAAACRGVKLPEAACDSRAAAAKAAGRRPPDRWAGRGWTAEQEALLGTAPDAEVAARVGRTAEAVRCRRTGKGIATVRDGRRGFP